jgi:FkbM family methyltransferase
MRIVQIGCNNGDDEIYKIINTQHVDFALLVDANPFVIEDLAKVRYKSFNNVKIECHLISNDVTEKFFYIPHFEGHKYSQHSSLSKEHIINHGHKLEDSKSFLMKPISIEKLFESNNLDIIDYLYIDCEGEDFNIINSVDFEKFNIKKITFEHAHIPNRDENYPFILNKLKNYGYEIDSIILGNITLIKNVNCLYK